MTKQRLYQVLNEAGVGRTIQETKEFIFQGKVTIEGKRCTRLDFQVDPTKKKVLVEGRTITSEEKFYFLLNKPKGYSSQKYDRAPYVGTFLSRFPVSPVGRLDVNTTGLLIMTNDGKLSSFITSPNRHIPKTYVATLDKEVIDKHMYSLRQGVPILVDEREYITLPAQVERGKNKTIRITIMEGKKRQVRLMFQSVGYIVQELQRISIGRLTLGTLKEREWKRVTKDFILKHLK